jgi:hypothetical protein
MARCLLSGFHGSQKRSSVLQLARHTLHHVQLNLKTSRPATGAGVFRTDTLLLEAHSQQATSTAPSS